MKKIAQLTLSICLLLISNSFNAQTFTNYTTSNGLPHDNVNCLVEDTLGNMWFGTQNGIAMFDGVSNWTYYTTITNPSLADNVITAIAVDANNNIWVGTDFGASVFDGLNFTTYTTANGLGNNRINYIKQAANGDIWFGDFSGATVYDGVNFTAFGTAAGLPFGGVNYVDFDSNDDVYLASGLGGFVKYDGAVFTIYNQTNGLVSNVVRAITIDDNDNKWIGTAKGLSVFNSSNTFVGNHTIMYVLPPPDTLNPVVDVKINSLGAVWTGIYVDYLVTVGGIAAYSGTQWNDYDVNDGLVGPVIRKITIDRNDNIWVATSTGVSKISNVTAIEEQEYLSTKLSVYPNPANSVINIKIDENLNNTSIEIYNSAMQLVKQTEIKANQKSKSVDVSDINRGLYFVKIGNEVTKVVVN